MPETRRTAFEFIGGHTGPWRVRSQVTVRGEGLPPAARLDPVAPSRDRPTARSDWTLRGLASNLRYATRDEVTALRSRQEGLGRPEALCAALIPIRKSSAWWELAQDERRAIFEEQSHHTRIGLDYLPGIARQLFHARDLGEPFDFLTWFEYAPGDEAAFDELVARLRATAEWSFVEREVDIRLTREAT